MMKKLILTISCLVFLLMSLTICWAEDPSALVVVRASDGSLWKATCLSNSCTAFTNFPGNFASEPSVMWDERLSKYVIWGRASNNSIWRATFTSAGGFDDNWASIPGATTSPIGAAGGYFPAGSNSVANGVVDVSTLSTNCSARTNVASITITPKRSGDFTVIATGMYDMTTDDRWVSVCLSNVSGGSSCSGWSPYIEATTTTNYESEKSYAISERFSVSADTSYTFYLKACRETSATGNLYWHDMTGIFTTREY